jgi:hypothetical protein
MWRSRQLCGRWRECRASSAISGQSCSATATGCGFEYLEGPVAPKPEKIPQPHARPKRRSGTPRRSKSSVPRGGRRRQAAPSRLGPEGAAGEGLVDRFHETNRRRVGKIARHCDHDRTEGAQFCPRGCAERPRAWATRRHAVPCHSTLRRRRVAHPTKSRDMIRILETVY